MNTRAGLSDRQDKHLRMAADVGGIDNLLAVWRKPRVRVGVLWRVDLDGAVVIGEGAGPMGTLGRCFGFGQELDGPLFRQV